ncbi:MAG: hypothetical protein Tsb0013_20060 [Phycisphaerales bacterium]
MTDPDYLKPYTDAMQAHGPAFEATLWHSPEKQLARFDVIEGMVDLTGRIVVDAGCGLGDFAVRLNEGGVEYGLYVGLEALPEFVEAAREREIPEAAFAVADFVADGRVFEDLATHELLQGHPIDVIVFSGSLNTLGEEAMLNVLGRAWDVAREAVVFNFLSTRHHRGPAGDETAPAIRVDPVRVLQWAMERTPNVLFRQEYFQGHDATVAMLKPV